MGPRAQQKFRTRRAIIDAALSQLSADTSFSNLSLREVTREAGLAPTSFYRHFKDMDELGLTLVDEAGLTLRQLMRQARQRIATGGGVIRTSVETFMEFVANNGNVFRLLLRERSGTSPAFRQAVNREIQHFIAELTDYLRETGDYDANEAWIQSEAMVTLVFSAGANALDMTKGARQELAERVMVQLKLIARGAQSLKREKGDKADAQEE
ncbi:HTH-type transcriptional repressor FabR [Gallaecimonas sp. GXIMD4217]|uniref:HTH-type transcriptional repressor FabR n=1 Tax=Gallaecimonas sp. GXIMD4217 TaxID=3131927 RepID=UPI00311B0A6C